MTNAEMVEEFHRVFKLDTTNKDFADDKTRTLRMRLLIEEFDEYMQAEASDDRVEIADALADMLYIIYGTALVYKIPLDEIFAEVHRSNMTKLDTDGKPIIRSDGKVMKGLNYEAPRIKEILDKV
jgi:predicted HAD superfamily Cof-like phosphohydrolase